MLGRGLGSLIPSKNQPEKQTDGAANSQKENEPTSVFKTNESFAVLGIEKEERKEMVVGEEEEIGLRKVREEFKILPKKFQEAVFHIEVEKIIRNPWQPRSNFNEESLKELAQSIREFGIIQPLIVSKVVKETDTGTEVEYQLISGERRLMAAKMAGLERVPVIIREINAQREKLEVALIENLQRSDLNPLEAAKAYARLQEEAGLTQKEIANRIGKSREAVANTLRLLNLPLEMQMVLAQNKINESQARALLAISSPEEQKKMFNEFLSRKVPSRVTQKSSPPQPIDPEQHYWQEKLEEKLGAPVKLVKKGQKGKMVIHFYSEEEWRMILEKLLGKEES